MMNYLYAQRDTACVAALTQKQKDLAREDVALAALRFVDSQQDADYVLLRFAVCRYQTYDNLAREASSSQREAGAR